MVKQRLFSNRQLIKLIIPLAIEQGLTMLVGLYRSLSPETVALARVLVRIYSGCGIVLWPLSFVLPNALRAANDVKFTMWVGVGSMVVFRILFSWILCV